MKTINYRFSTRDFEKILVEIDNAVEEAKYHSPLMDKDININFSSNMFTGNLTYCVWGYPSYEKDYHKYSYSWDIQEWSFLHKNSYLRCPKKLSLGLNIEEWKYISESYYECIIDDYEITSIHLKIAKKKYYYIVSGFSIFGKGIQDGLYYRFDYEI